MASETLPSPGSILVETPLYQKFSFQKRQIWEVIRVLYFSGTYDSYCPECRQSSTFQAVHRERPEGLRNKSKYALQAMITGSFELPDIPTGIHVVRTLCARESSHRQYFILLVEAPEDSSIDNDLEKSITFQKIGQHPSHGDAHLAQSSLKKYSSVLSKEKLGELRRAIGLASHDVGIGAYVYLRRIFEGLIEEAHALAKLVEDWDETKYKQSRVVDRIEILKDYLPSFLVKNRNIYGLLSKGLHELSENECLTHFETLRFSIEMILDEKLQERERKAKEKSISDDLQKVANSLNG